MVPEQHVFVGRNVVHTVLELVGRGLERLIQHVNLFGQILRVKRVSQKESAQYGNYHYYCRHLLLLLFFILRPSP